MSIDEVETAFILKAFLALILFLLDVEQGFLGFDAIFSLNFLGNLFFLIDALQHSLCMLGFCLFILSLLAPLLGLFLLLPECCHVCTNVPGACSNRSKSLGNFF